MRNLAKKYPTLASVVLAVGGSKNRLVFFPGRSLKSSAALTDPERHVFKTVYKSNMQTYIYIYIPIYIFGVDVSKGLGGLIFAPYLQLYVYTCLSVSLITDSYE